MCIIYFGTVDNTFFFYIGSLDWHHEVFLLPTERRICGPLGLNFLLLLPGLSQGQLL